jgi:hypothetical protein
MLDFIEQSPLHKNTYSMLMGDNGPALPKGVRSDPFDKLVSCVEKHGFRPFLHRHIGAVSTQGCRLIVSISRKQKLAGCGTALHARKLGMLCTWRTGKVWQTVAVTLQQLRH